MFTGIIEISVRVIDVTPSPAGKRLVIDVPWTDVRHGESVAVNGVCLTVVNVPPEPTGAALRSASRLKDVTPPLMFDVIPETLSKTTLGNLRPGDEVHVERSLRVGDRFDGHMVQGHVDGTAKVVAVRANESDWRITLEAPPELARYIIPKGSVTLDGVSLTVADVNARQFDVALIPTTLQITRLGQRKVGDAVNLECDAMVKTIVATLERMKVGEPDA